MTEGAKTVVMVVALVAIFEILKRLFGVGASLTVAMSALSFCVGALWMAGKKPEPTKDATKGD